MKEFSDNYKTTIGADFLSMDVTTENDKKVSLQVRRRCYTCSIRIRAPMQRPQTDPFNASTQQLWDTAGTYSLKVGIAIVEYPPELRRTTFLETAVECHVRASTDPV